MRVIVAVLALLALEVPAVADDGLFAGEQLFRPPIEWSFWLRAARGASHESSSAPDRSLARVPGERAIEGSWEAGVGAEASLPISANGNLRLGGWAEARGSAADDLFAGSELVVTRVPKRLDMFLYEGHGILALRGGRSATHATASLVYGYLAPYWLEGPCRERFYGIKTGVCQPRPKRHARYMTGVRLVGTMTWSLDQDSSWVATVGIELEPIGALRMLTVARSWY